MPFSLSNKLKETQNPLFAIANSTPMISPAIQGAQQPAAFQLPVAQKSATIQSTTPVVQSDPTSLGSYKGVPIKYGDSNQIAAQIRAIDATQAGGLVSSQPSFVQDSPTKGLVSVPQMSRGSYQQTPEFKEIIANLLEKGNNEDERVQKARDDLVGFQQSTADKIAAIKSTPIPLEFQQGRAQAVQEASQIKEAALEQAVTNSLTSRGQTLDAIKNAATLASPQLSGYGQTFYNPLTGGNTDSNNGSALNPINNIQSIAQQVIRGQISPQQAYALGGSVQNFEGALNQAILSIDPNFNVANAQGQFNARQSNTQTMETAPVDTAAGAYSKNYPVYLQTQAQLRNVDEIGNLLLKTAQGGAINPLAPQFANQTIANFRSQLSSPDQAKFNSTLAAFQGAASQLLSEGSGQIPTDVSKNIAAISNGSLSLGALRAMVEQAKLEGNIKLQTAASIVNQPGSTIGAPSVNAPTPSATQGVGGTYEDYLKVISQ